MTLPSITLPVETDEYVGPLLTIQWDGTDTTDVELAATPYGGGTIPTFTAYPGPKVPTTTGYYLIQVSKDGIVRDLAILIMVDQ